MEKIENVENPIVGESYLVKCVNSNKPIVIGELINWMPVFGLWHNDKGVALPDMHFHIDWRFIPYEWLRHWEKVQHLCGHELYENAYYFNPVTEFEIKDEDYCNNSLPYTKYYPLTYLRDFENFPDIAIFKKLEQLYENNKLVNFICPHKGTNLRSCKIKNKSVQCPAHGLTWNVETGELITD